MFLGRSIENWKNTISELYQNLTFETLSGAREIQFEWISDLDLYITFYISHFTYHKLQHSILSNTKKKDSDTKKYNESLKEKYDFDEKPCIENKFEEQIVMEILNNVPYNHIKTEE